MSASGGQMKTRAVVIKLIRRYMTYLGTRPDDLIIRFRALDDCLDDELDSEDLFKEYQRIWVHIQTQRLDDSQCQVTKGKEPEKTRLVRAE